jgi:hypothetical protein
MLRQIQFKLKVAFICFQLRARPVGHPDESFMPMMEMVVTTSRNCHCRVGASDIIQQLIALHRPSRRWSVGAALILVTLGLVSLTDARDTVEIQEQPIRYFDESGVVFTQAPEWWAV